MKHLISITQTPSQAVSVVEFDGLLAIFGRTLTQLNGAIDFVLMVLGLPGEVNGVKGGGE